MTPNSKSIQRQQLIRWWGWIWLATVALALLIAQRYLIVVQPPILTQAVVFRWTMLAAHLGSISLLALCPGLLLARLWPNIRPVVVIGVTLTLAVLLLAVLLVDTHIYQLYRMHLDMGVMNLLFGGAAGETFIFPGVMYAQAIGVATALAVAMGLIGWGLWRYVQRAQPQPRVRWTLITGYALCVIGFHGVHAWADARAYEPLLVQTDVLPMRYAATAKRFMRDLGVELRPRMLDARSADGGSALAYPLQPVSCTKKAKSPNIVLIMIDSWRFDAFNERVTPNIARFARNASTFTKHFSGGNATRIGVFSLFYSIPGTYWHRVLNESQGPVIMRELLDQQYDIQVFRSTPIFSPEFDRTVFVEVPGVRVRSDGDRPSEWDRDLTNDFKQFLAQRDSQRPFFSFLFYDSPHGFDFPSTYELPFQPSLSVVNYLTLNNDSDPKPFFNRYRNSVHYTDSLIGESLQAIESAGLADDTIIILTGDHGQEFNESGNNFWGHNSNFSRYQTSVPLIWYQPGRAAAVYEHRTSHFDVMPTLLHESLNCDVPFDHISVGQPLFDTSPRDVMVMSDYNEFAIVEPNQVATVRRSGVSLFDTRYQPLRNSQIAPEVLAKALEQKQRFYKGFSRERGQN